MDLIFTRDNDRWLVALRNPTTGAFEGTLSTIDAQHAYWVRASATTTVSVEIPSQGAQQLLPRIEVKGDQWNLVPVISLLPLKNLAAGVTTLDAGNYFGGANWTKAFTFDRGQWEAVVPGPEALLGQRITFWIVNDFGRIQARETAVFEEPANADALTQTLNLSFDDPLPSAPPTPTR